MLLRSYGDLFCLTFNTFSTMVLKFHQLLQRKMVKEEKLMLLEQRIRHLSIWTRVFIMVSGTTIKDSAGENG